METERGETDKQMEGEKPVGVRGGGGGRARGGGGGVRLGLGVGVGG